MEHKFNQDVMDNNEGLALCDVCQGAEGTLPTDCPGRHLTEAEERSIWDREIDFKEGKWLVLRGEV